jgi:hypothetical protein
MFSGWWSQYCGVASLNGEYNPVKLRDGYGLFLVIWGQFVINPERTKMMIRGREEKKEEKNLNDWK